MNDLFIPDLPEARFKRCFFCKTSLGEEYDDDVVIIQNKSGVHFICKACALKMREKQKPGKKVA